MVVPPTFRTHFTWLAFGYVGLLIRLVVHWNDIAGHVGCFDTAACPVILPATILAHVVARPCELLDGTPLTGCVILGGPQRAAHAVDAVYMRVLERHVHLIEWSLGRPGVDHQHRFVT